MMRTKPINSLRVISRNARNIKDPNPLQTMLMTLSCPFPVSVDTQRAKKAGIPSHLFRKDRDGNRTSDNHYSGSSLVKYEALEWWLEHSPLPSPSATDVINIMRKAHRREAELYYSIDWGMSKVQFGRMSLQRKPIATKTVDVSLSRNLREAAIEQIFLPEQTVDYIQIPGSVMEELRKMVNENLHTGMLIATQLRILMNQLNPNYRYLPVMADSGDLTAILRHAFCQRLWKISGVSMASDLRSNEIHMIVEKICDVLLEIAHESPDKFQKTEKAIKTFVSWGSTGCST